MRSLREPERFKATEFHSGNLHFAPVEYFGYSWTRKQNSYIPSLTRYFCLNPNVNTVQHLSTIVITKAVAILERLTAFRLLPTTAWSSCRALREERIDRNAVVSRTIYFASLVGRVGLIRASDLHSLCEKSRVGYNESPTFRSAIADQSLPPNVSTLRNAHWVIWARSHSRP
jgi:hypothetical protein